MTKFKAPEVATSQSGLEDSAFSDGSPLSAHKVRVLARSVNRSLQREALVWRWLGDGASVFVPPYWGELTPCSRMPIFYSEGVDALRVRIRLEVEATSFNDVSLGCVTSRQLFGQLGSTKVDVTPSGLGSSLTATFNVPVSGTGQDELTFFWRYNIDGGETLLATGTYGGTSGGAFEYGDRLLCSTEDPSISAPWVTSQSAASVQRSGFYALVSASSGQRLIAEVRDGRQDATWYYDGVSGVVDATLSTLYFQPAFENITPSLGYTYELRELPKAILSSVAVYEVRNG